MIDSDDSGTLDCLPAKKGRPCTDPNQGPQSTQQRQAAYRAGKKVIQFRVSEEEKAVLVGYCKLHGMSRDGLLRLLVAQIVSLKDPTQPPGLAFL
ncbi:MAG: hypothetical protein L3J28_04415 [Candidatus Polarisedimenticolaceae bacterium]|nr:hypothetical protein [Candidatus Polarisedimenticolaceae bacterium]